MSVKLPTTCTWCEEPFLTPMFGSEPKPKKITIQMATSHGANRISFKPVYLCSTGCLSEWAANLHAENPEWHRPVEAVS